MKTSGSKCIAERYVRALFEVAEGASALDAVEADLQALAHAIEQSEELRHFLTNPLLTREQQAESVAALLAKMKAHKITAQFIAMLSRQKRLPILPEIIAMFGQWVEAARGEMRAEVISAAALKDKEINMIAERLGKAYGKKMKLEMRQNPGLLGGVVVKIGSLQLDSSLAGKMDRLKLALQTA